MPALLPPSSDPSPAELLKRWHADTARRLRADSPPPANADEAAAHARRIRRALLMAMGEAYLPPGKRPPLDPHVHRTLERDGYRVELLTFQTHPGCRVTASLYLPTSSKGPFPTVLCPHGHWSGARRDPVVQARCIGLAKLGFVALTLDAWGAGERGTRAGQNEYHGGLLGASLWPVGTPLHGLQLFENVRALDYLQSRPEVNGKRLGCTGASGGGNQTTQLSAFDPRVRCAVPVCSVGTFTDYLNAACCVDEVLRGALTFAEEGDLLGLVAPGGLMVITASRDSYHFGPESSRAALDRARSYFAARDAEAHLAHRIFDSGHDYSRPMREAMYGWMHRHLKDEGDGAPIPEPEYAPEEPEALRCFPPSERPAAVMTTVAWVRKRVGELTAETALPEKAAAWPEERQRRVRLLRELLRLPKPDGIPGWTGTPEGGLLTTEAGIVIPVRVTGAGARRAVIALHPGGRSAVPSGFAGALMAAGTALYAPELRGCGELTLPGQELGSEIPDHNLAEWGLWLDRPLLGQWVQDVLRLVEKARDAGATSLAVVGWREAGLAALLAAALSPGVSATAAVETVATYETETPPHQQRMVVFPSDLLRLGDVPQLAALAAPNAILIANPVRLDGMSAPAPEVERRYAPPRALYATLGHADRFVARADVTEAILVEHLTDWLTQLPPPQE
jgi:dienelactone hydrolase